MPFFDWIRHRPGRARQERRTLRAAVSPDRQILALLMDPGASVDMTGRFVEVNSAFESMVGYRESELRQMTYRDLTPERWREFEESTIQEQVLRRGYSDVYRKEYRCKNGATIPVELRKVLLHDSQGRPSGMWAMVRDISERVSAEERLRESQNFLTSIIEQSPTPTWISDHDGTLLKINKACRELLHITEDEVLGRYNVFRDELVESQGLAPIIRRAYEEKVPVRFRIIWDAAKIRHLSFKDHAAVVLHTSVFPIVDASGRVTNAVFQHQDVTGLTQAEAEKARLEVELLQAQKMESIGRLAGGVAHDFNNMLGVILGCADLIRSRLSEGDANLADIEEIQRAAERSAEITSQLLAFSRKQPAEPQVIDLNSAIHQIRSTLARVIGEDIELRFDPAADLRKVRMDNAQLSQVLMNLAANARDAMPNGGVLRIVTGNADLDARYCREHVDRAAGPYVCVTVEDNGIGMDAETRSHLFEPFFTTKGPGRGTGLGLASTYGIVRQNSGFIDVTSRHGAGTSFQIYLPAVANEETTAEPSGRPSIDRELVNARVLVVEDDAMVRSMTTSMLASLGCAVTVAENPRRAIQILQESPQGIDLVISDVIMPGMTGVQMRDFLQRIKPDVRMLFMSGYTADAIAHRGILPQGVHFLPKPFHRSTLAKKVREALADCRVTAED